VKEGEGLAEPLPARQQLLAVASIGSLVRPHARNPQASWAVIR
jgi:hypothetical protein